MFCHYFSFQHGVRGCLQRSVQDGRPPRLRPLQVRQYSVTINLKTMSHRLNKAPVYSCTTLPPPRIWTLIPKSYTRELLVSQDRRDLFVTPCDAQMCRLCMWRRSIGIWLCFPRDFVIFDFKSWTGWFFGFFSMYVIQHRFIFRPSDSPVSEDGIESTTVATLSLTSYLLSNKHNGTTIN
jgi:hypothetical protein